MAITLASDSLSDASITDGIGAGDLRSAARLWVRHWPTALAASRLYVDRAEVPGLAAEALIGTISMTALGRGPREGVSAFVASAVRELGEDDEPPAVDIHELAEVYASPRLSRAFAELPLSAQQVLREVAHGGSGDEHVEDALTVLQSSYLTSHLGDAPSRECRPTHVSMLAAVEGRTTSGFSGTHWLHMSTCAWCTEAFHEIAFSNLALDALIVPAVLAAPVEAPLPPEVAEPVLAAVVEEEQAAEQPTPHRAGVHVLLSGGRKRLMAAVAVTAAAAVIALVLAQTLGGTDDGTAPTSATGTSEAQPTPEAALTGGSDANILGSTDPERTPSGDPSATVAGPLSIPTPSGSPIATLTPQDDEPDETPSPTPKPTRKPDPTPSAPGTSAAPDPEPTPDPTPSATPTVSCNGLQHLLGFC